ncbi:spidroin-2-like isoform X3 [Gopherus flavomarginatus]|uniref:spidroin-2-like isoform X3 n=1 Tax=Gopherus flavomarginatus TaxID=286002 RepID=UPI0021CC323B|nr:spidroin-2-like isoform X3 [Gopherus flavomarginatus]
MGPRKHLLLVWLALWSLLGLAEPAPDGPHSLAYHYVGTYDASGLLEFGAAGLLDGAPIDGYDRAARAKVPAQPWVGEGLGPEYWRQGGASRAAKEDWFRRNVETLKQRSNQTQGPGGVRPGEPALAGGSVLGRDHTAPLGRPARVRGAAAPVPGGHLRGVAGPVPAQPAHLGQEGSRPPAAGLVPPDPRAPGLADSGVPGLGVPHAGHRGVLAAGRCDAAGGRGWRGAAQRGWVLPTPEPPMGARERGPGGAVPGQARGPGDAAGDYVGSLEAGTVQAAPGLRGRGARTQLIPWVWLDFPLGCLGSSPPKAGHVNGVGNAPGP